MALARELSAYLDNMKKNAPAPVLEPILTSIDNHKQSFNRAAAIKQVCVASFWNACIQVSPRSFVNM
jgi:hypothetical protein